MSHQKKNFVTEPNKHDVLYGRGNDVNFNPGNIHFRALVEALKVDYHSALRRDKPLFSAFILKTIKNSSPPGRFLKKDKRGDFLWHEVEDKEARRKIRQALRDNRKYVENLELNEEADRNASNLPKEVQSNEKNNGNDSKELVICGSSSVRDISKIEESISGTLPEEDIGDVSIMNELIIEPLQFESCFTENNGNDINKELIICESSSAVRDISKIEESMFRTPEEDIDDSIMNKFLAEPLQFESCFASDEQSFWEQY